MGLTAVLCWNNLDRECELTTGATRPDTTLYRAIASDLRRAIESGALSPGTELPTEKDLMARYAVSRNTVRLALTELAYEGLITSAQGRGRTVRRHDLVTYHASHVESTDQRIAAGTDAFIADISAQGRQPTQEINIAMVPAPVFVSERLGVEVDEFVVVRRRLRAVDGVRSSIADSYYPRSIAEGTAIMKAGDITEGVIAYLAARGFPQTRYRDELSTRMPSSEEASRLSVGPGTPVLVQIRTGYSGETPVRVTLTVMPGDRNKIVYELPTS